MTEVRPVSFNRVLARALVATMCACAVGEGTAHADPLRIRVRGGARIEARATRSGGELVLSGALLDDMTQPLPNQPVEVLFRPEAATQLADVSAAVRGARLCVNGGSTAATSDGEKLRVMTDERGTFCVRAALPLDRHRALLTWGGDSLVEGTKLELPFDLSRRSVALRFDPAIFVVKLDAPSVRVEVAALVEETEGPTAAPSLPITLTTESGTALGRATTDRSGRARFTVESARLGGAGPGELRAAFPGDVDNAFASSVTAIERHARVTLRAPAAEKGLSPQSPEDGVAVDIDATGAGGIVGSGGVEAYVGESLVGAAPVERGLARLVMTFNAPAGQSTVRVRYVSTAPWYEPGPELSFTVPVRGPSVWSKVPLFAAAIGVIAWFVAARVRRREAPDAEEKADELVRASEGRARVDVVAPPSRGERGWSGAVLDAHDGAPIDKTRVWIERPGFEGTVELASATTDERGRFRLEPVELRGGERLCAEARLHSRLEQDVPSPGRLSVTLVARRRQVIARLVAWARRAGKPFDSKPEPTPAHVRRAARDDEAVARWADAVERAAYQPGEVDARKEAEIERLLPDSAEKPSRPVDRH